MLPEERDPIAWFIREAKAFRSKGRFIKLEPAYDACVAATRCGKREAIRAAQQVKSNHPELFRSRGGKDRT